MCSLWIVLKFLQTSSYIILIGQQNLILDIVCRTIKVKIVILLMKSYSANTLRIAVIPEVICSLANAQCSFLHAHDFLKELHLTIGKYILVMTCR